MSENNIQYRSIDIVKRLFREYVKPNILLIVVSMVCSVIMGLSIGISAFLISPMLDNIFIKKSEEMLYIIPAVIVGNAIVSSLASYYQSFCVRIMSQKIIFSLQEDLYSHLLRADMVALDKHHSGKIISRFTNDMNGINLAMCRFFSKFFFDMMSISFLIAVMLYYDPKLTIIAMGILPVSAFTILYFGRKVKIVADKIYRALGAFSSRVESTFKNISLVKSNINEGYEEEQMKHMLQNLMTPYKKVFALSAMVGPVIELLSSLAIVAVIFYAGSKVIYRGGSVGSFFAFASSLLMSYRHLKSLSKVHSAVNDGVAACKGIFDILDESPAIVDKEGAIRLEGNFSKIVFNSVSFGYKRKGSILKDISLEINKGEKVALVGKSGSGKSTILQLMQRFYDARSGSISIDGINITDITLSSLRKMISVVSQESAIFYGSVQDNIRYSRLNASLDEVKEAARLAAADGFIENLEGTYEAIIGPGGIKLSGGQKQRIAIARAILKDAPILLLDEATSALDSESEIAIQTSMKNILQDRTTIIIAHRLSTITNSDKICYVDNGRIVEQGSHKALLEKGGAYASFYKNYLQANEML